MIGLPAGSNVRVEFTSSLSAPDWQPLKVISNLPYSPYAFVCGEESTTEPQRFYRAVPLP